jgi:hypothetical protein
MHTHVHIYWDWDKFAVHITVTRLQARTCHQKKIPPPGNTMRGLTGRSDVALLAMLSSSGILLKR